MHLNRLAQWLRIPALALFSILLASCGSGDGESSVDAPGADAASNKLRMVFRDDFGGPNGVPRVAGKAPLTVDNWRVETGYGSNGWGNDEWQLYQDSVDNVFIENGNLVISAQCATAPACGKRDDSITSARITTKDRLNVRYGNIKARIKMPSGLGMWPAFWTLGSDIDARPWPDAGEIDIVEMHYFYSDTRTTHFSTHWSGPKYTPETKPSCASGVISSLDPNEEENCNTANKTFDEPLAGNSPNDDDPNGVPRFHIYELDWNENRVVGKIDGITYFTQAIDPSTMEEFLKDHFLILNVAVGGTLGGMFGPQMSVADWSNPAKTDMLVDWVEVYEKIPPSTGTLIDESGNNLQYNRIINTAEFNGAFVELDLDSTAVTPLVGSTVLELNYSTSVSPNGGIPAFFSGAIFDFNQIDLSSYTKIVFSIDFSQFPEFDDIGVEFQDSRYDPGNGIFVGSVQLRTSAYAPIAENGNWRTYEIPLSDFAGVNLDDITAIGFFNPNDVMNNLIAGTLYLDDIRFATEPCNAAGSVAFNADDYGASSTTGSVSVDDACAASALASVMIDTGFGNAIVVAVDLDAAGQGSTSFNFGSPTNDETSTIAIADGDLLTATFTDASGVEQLDMATISDGGGSSPLTLGLYSESNTNPVLPYSAIINGADFGGNQTIADENSTAVTPFDGSLVLSIDFQDTGATYGGAIFDIGGGDVSAYDSLKFAIDTSAVASFADLVVQIEDGSAAPNVFLSAYTPTMSNNWAVYEIPLADFGGVNLVNVTLLGFWNMSSTAGSVTLTYGTIYLDDIHFAASAPPPAGNTLGVFSETNTNPVLAYTGITNSADFGGNQTIADENSMAVTPFDGSVVLAIDYQDNGASFGGAILEFGGGDVSAYDTLVFSIDTSAVAGFANLTLQSEPPGPGPVAGNNVNLSDYTPTSTTGNWSTYAIPLSDFFAVDPANFGNLGFWNARDAGGALVFGPIYLDDIHFAGATPPPPPPPAGNTLGVFSETNTNPVLAYTGITNSADFGGNQTIADENSMAVTPFDGSVVLAIDYQDNGASFGGAILEFGGGDVSAYDTLVFSIDTSAVAGFANLTLQSEPPGPGPVAGNNVNLSDYTPTSTTGNWSTYAIPLSDFFAVDPANFGNLGFWNARDAGGALVFGPIYLDDIHFAASAPPPPSGCTPSCTIDFEVSGAGNAGFTWDVFENDGDTLLEIITNPDQTGINTSATVARVTARQAGAFFAGAQTAHGDIGPLTLDDTNGIVKIMVWKSVISPVGIQFADAANAAQPPVLVANTVVDQWEELTFDFSPFFGLVGNVDADRLVVFPDWDQAGRAQDNIVYFDNITFSAVAPPPPPPPPPPPAGTTLGVFSETNTGTVATYTGITNSADFGGNQTIADDMSMAVTPFDGSLVLEIDYQDNGSSFGGAIIEFGSIDVSAYTTLVFSIDTSAVPGFADLTLQSEPPGPGPIAGNNVFLSDYTPTSTTGNWSTYAIPLSDFFAVDPANFGNLGFWNARDAGGALVFGPIYLDDIHFAGATPPPPPPPAGNTLGVFSETNTNPVLAYTGITNSADFGGNQTIADENSMAVTPFDGSVVLAIDYQDNGASFGGAILEFGGGDVSAYDTLVFSIDTSAVAGFANLTLQSEPPGPGPVAGNNVNLSDYTPTSTTGNWSTYAIPLSDFFAVDPANFGNLGFWNARDAGGALVFGPIYLDDIHFAASAPPPPSGCTPSCTIDFEVSGAGNAGFTWDVFENDGDTLLEIITNPDQTGINTSATVARVTARQAGAFFAGAQTAHGDIGPLTLDDTNGIVKIMVWKSVISPVGIQFADAANAAQPPVLVANTVVDQWEELTFDFSPFFGLVGNVDADRLVVFPDWDQAGRAQDNIVYFDNITFSAVAPPPPPPPPPPPAGTTLGVFSETNTGTVATYTGITNSADFGGNQTIADDMSMAVTPFDGSLVLEIDYQDNGSSFGGAIIEFGSIDVSAYTTLVFSIDTSAVPGFADLTLQSEPPGPGPIAGNNVFLSDYTPTSTTGNWSTYAIPLSDFFAVDPANFGNLGFWNARDAGGALVFGPIYLDDIHFAGATPPPPPPPAGNTLGVFSETNTNPVLAYTGITNSADFGGNQTIADENSMAVTPFDGSVVLAIDYQDNGASFGGAILEFGGGDVSAYDTLVFSIDTSAVAGFANLTLQSEPPGPGPVAGNNVNLSDYTPTSTTGNWSTYAIPLSDFFAVDPANFGNLGFWNARDAGGALVFGPIYLDDIHFAASAPPPAGNTLGVFSETNTNPVLAYTGITNSADFGGNQTIADENSMAVTPFDGSVVLAIDYQDNGASFGGAILEFGGGDVSAYDTLVFSIDTSAVAGFANLTLQSEPPGPGPVAGNNVNLSDYTPTSTTGNWSTYAIPLSDFFAVDPANFGNLGFWNARDAGGALVFGPIYLDDIHFAASAPPPPSGEIAVNGNFDTDDFTGWTQFPSPLTTQTIVVDPTTSSNVARLFIPVAAGGVNNVLKQERLLDGTGTLNDGDIIDFSFDYRGEPGEGIMFVKSVCETATSVCGDLVHNGGGPFTPTPNWTNFADSFTLAAGVTGYTLEFAVVCGTTGTCTAEYFIDNVTVTIR